MILTERHFHKGNAEILRLCETSAKLYNRCNHLMRQSWFTQQHLKIKKLPNINILYKYVKQLDLFRGLHNTKTVMQTVRKVLNDWSNFLKALRAYKINKSKFLGRPKPPGFKKKLAQVIFYNETIKGGSIEKRFRCKCRCSWFAKHRKKSNP